jgi:hypothetical protein
MTVHKRLIGAAALAATMAFGIDVQAQGPRFNETVTVQASKAGLGDHALTFSAPVALPGLSLAAGTYIFRHPLDNVIQVSSATGQAYKMFITIPRFRRGPTDTYSIILGAPPAPDSPRRILALFAPGETMGQEFVYAN